MSEYMKRYYTREEDFLDKFGMSIGAALKVLGDEWQPDWHCDDDARHNREYFLKTGKLSQLVFDGAAVYHDENGCSLIHLCLKSSKRIVTVRLKKVGGEFVAEKIVDRAIACGEDAAPSGQQPSGDSP